MIRNEISQEQKLDFHLKAVLCGERRFESAAQAVERMILEKKYDKLTRGGRTVYDFRFFREGKKHVIGWFEELNELFNFVQEAAKGGSAAEMAFVFVGEPGNGKTFVIEYLCDGYRRFLARPENRRYTFEFVGLERLGTYGNIRVIQSQTFEDPLVLAMNLYPTKEENIKYFLSLGATEDQIERFWRHYRPLGACSEYIWNNDIRNFCGGDTQKMLDEFVRIVPVPLTENLGTVTGKYSPGDKITSSAAELRGEEDLTRVLNLADTSNPYKYNLRRGALARVGGGGIHFSDELFRHKQDLVNVYLQVIQNRTIELDGYRWPVDTLILATSNNERYNQFIAEPDQAPIKDRCRVCYVSHNTDYKLQQELTSYAIGAQKKTSVSGEDLHEDPNLNYVLSVAVTLTRLPHSEQLTPVETMKLEAGEVAGEKSVKTLVEVKRTLSRSQDVTKRWGQKGIGHRGLGRIVQRLLALPETHEGKCLFAKDAFEAFEAEINDYVSSAVDREKYLKDLETAKRLYREAVKTSIFNAYRDDPDAIRKDVMAYVNMVIGMDAEDLGPEKIWRYRDPSGKQVALKIDQSYINSVEERLGLKTEERRKAFRTTIRKIHGQKILVNPNYDFTDNQDLVKAVTDVRLESDVGTAASLVGALANRTNEENVKVYNRMIDTMLKKLGYCLTCAQKTIEYYITKEDES